MVIEIHSRFDDALKHAWCDLEGVAELFGFQTHDWLKHWYRLIGKPLYGIQIQIVILHQEGKIAAIFPLGIRTVATIRILEWLGGVQTDYHAPILSSSWSLSKSQFVSCWEEILRRLPLVDVVHLRRQPLMIGNLGNPFQTLDNSLYDGESFFLDLPESYEMLCKRSAVKRILSDSRRQRRRLADFGRVEFSINTGSQISTTVVRELINMKRQRYKEQRSVDQLKHNSVRQFYEEFKTNVGDDGKVYIGALKVGAEIVAAHWGIVYRDRFYYLIPAFKGGKWKKYSVGRLLLESLLEWSINQGLKIFDFTIGAEEYKRTWCDSKVTLFQTIKCVSWKGEIYSVLCWIYRLVAKYKWANI